MKALITGVNGYIGRHLALRLLEKGHTVVGIGRADRPFDNRIQYHKVDIGDDAAMQVVLSEERPEAVFHLAAIVHESGKGKPWVEWERINVRASAQLAKLSYQCSVRWFMQMSTIAVYDSVPRSLRKGIHITADTPTIPATDYGRSKLLAEGAVRSFETDQFRVLVVRPPMIYGKHCPGNYERLRALALKLGAAPALHNQRSTLHIDGLVEFLLRAMEQQRSGLCFPQDDAYSDTADMIRAILELNGPKARSSKLLAMGVKMGAHFLPALRKALGNLTIDKSLSGDDGGGLVFSERMKLTEPWQGL